MGCLCLMWAWLESPTQAPSREYALRFGAVYSLTQ